jgi:hypothetical protein
MAVGSVGSFCIFYFFRRTFMAKPYRLEKSARRLLPLEVYTRASSVLGVAFA